MSKWVLQGLRTGVKTTRYPDSAETAAGVSPGRPCGMLTEEPERTSSAIALCPTGAIRPIDEGIAVDHPRCVHCFRCTRGKAQPLDHEWGYEWASLSHQDRDPSLNLGKPFTRSMHVRLVDAGACRACLSEIEQLGKPYYNIHRLGFFMTPTPRHADVLLVAGPVTDNMRLPLQKAYRRDAHPKEGRRGRHVRPLRGSVRPELHVGSRSSPSDSGGRRGSGLPTTTFGADSWVTRGRGP